MGNREMLGRVTIILLSIFVVMSGYGVLLPVLPYYTERLALKSGVLADEEINYHIGILTSIYPFFQLIFAVVWGKLSDRFGRKTLIIMGLIGFSLMQIMTGLANSLLILYLARILGGIFSSSVIPVCNAYLSDLTNSKQRRKMLAWSGVAVSSGVIAGPMIGGYLAQTNVHFNTAIGHFLLDRFSIPFLVIALFGIVVLVVVMLRLKNPKKQYTNNQQRKLKLTGVLSNPIFLRLLLLSLVIQLAATLFETVFSVYAKDILVFDTAQVGLGFMLCGLIMAVLQPLFASFDENILPMRWQLIIGFLLAAFSMGIFTLITADLYVFTMIIIFATGGAMVTPNLITSISFIDENNTGTYLSIQTSANSIGQVLGPLLGIWIYSFGSSWPFLIIGITLLLVIMLTMPGLKFSKS